MSKGQYIILCVIGIILVVITSVIILNMIPQDQNKTQMDIIDESTEDMGYDYSQYDMLKEVVNRFNTSGGSVVDTDNRSISYPSSLYHATLKDDLLLIRNNSGTEVWIYSIHDIRLITVN